MIGKINKFYSKSIKNLCIEKKHKKSKNNTVGKI